MNTKLRRRDLLRSAVSFSLLAFAVACGPFHRGPSGEATVLFSNQSTAQADVYASGPDAMPIRLGTVMAGQTSTLTVPTSVVSQGGQVNVAAHLLAQPTGAPATGPFTLHPGDRVRVRLLGDMKTLSVVPD
jgi:hypothetical protein